MEKVLINQAACAWSYVESMKFVSATGSDAVKQSNRTTDLALGRAGMAAIALWFGGEQVWVFPHLEYFGSRTPEVVAEVSPLQLANSFVCS